jgi:hypothetical protein
MGVGEDFAKFKDNYNIGSELISSISYRYKRITRQLNKDFWNTDSDTAHSIYVGSYVAVQVSQAIFPKNTHSANIRRHIRRST